MVPGPSSTLARAPRTKDFGRTKNEGPRTKTWARIAALLLSCAAAVSSEAATPVPLVDAVKDGNRADVRALLQQKTNVNAAEADGTTALH